MSEYADDKKKPWENQFTGLTKECKSTFERYKINSLRESLKRQELLYRNAWSNPVRSMLDEQRKTMAPALNTLRIQEASLRPITSMLESQRVSMLNNLNLGIGFERLKHQTARLVGESFMRQKVMNQNKLEISLGLSALKQTAMSSVASTLKQQRIMIQDSLSPTFDFGALRQHAMGVERLNQSYLKSISERFQTDFHALSGAYSASMISSVAIKRVYESAVKDIEILYKEFADEKVENNPDSGIEQSDKEFLEEFIRYCKQVGSMLNTLNSASVWDILQKIATIYTIYSMITGATGGSETNYIGTPDIAPIEEKNEYNEEKNLSEEKHDYEIDIEKNIENMDIDAGKRT